MKIEDLKVGNIYKIKFLSGGPGANFCGKAKYCGPAPDYYPDGTLAFTLIDDEIDLGYFDIENVIQDLGPDDRKFKPCPHCGGLIETSKF